MTQLQKYTQTKEYLARNESPQIRGVDRKDFQPLIVQCCKLIGIRNDNIPQGIVTDLLHNFTIENLKSYTYDELMKRDKTNLDIFWLKDESLEGLPLDGGGSGRHGE